MEEKSVSENIFGNIKTYPINMDSIESSQASVQTIPTDNFSFKLILIIFIVVLFLMFIGFNVFIFFTQGLEGFSDNFRPFVTYILSLLGILNDENKIKEQEEQEEQEEQTKIVQLSSSESNKTNENNIQDYDNKYTENEDINKIIQNNKENNDIVDYQADDSSSSIQTKGKSGYCYIGEDRGFRSCAYVGPNDSCLSGDIFPTKDICINPKLRN